MNKYFPQYPILRIEDMVPRDRIQLVSDEVLGPIASAELKNLRRGVSYDHIIADTPQNRENMAVRAGYFQMVAYKEGWTFDPNKYQVRFVHPSDQRLNRVTGGSSMVRLLNYKDQEGNNEMLGFESRNDQKTFTRLEDRTSFLSFQWLRRVFGLK